MVVVVDVPGRDRFGPFILAVVLVGVEHLFGHDPLVALGFAVVLRPERLGLAVLGVPSDDAGEVARAVAGAVILVATGTARAVASAIGPEIFHDHMLMAQPSDSSVVTHAEQAFTSAWTLVAGA